MPYAGVYRGKDALRRIYSKVRSMMDAVPAGNPPVPVQIATREAVPG